MTTQKILIINFNSLYEILDEIKEILYFKLEKFENEQDFIKESDLDLTNSIIISKNKEQIKIKDEIIFKNLLIFTDLPLPLSKILELINIKLIKLKFNYQSKINVKEYELNLNSKFFSKGNLSLKLTEKEIEIISYLNKTKKKHSVSDLQKNIWSYLPGMETHTVETHIYRLRKKISEKFNDENLILSDKNGYYIN
jgi:hypothetical protein|tara:strand:- start:360 stop:947 length:588 start_codon:yes stop_codon:yes gene_type:complete